MKYTHFIEFHKQKKNDQMSVPKTEELPLRERKKELIRVAIRENAERLFEERGYDNVTVAEIADAANISVKTLFTYVRSKEDLLFQDTSLIDHVLEALARRSKKQGRAEAVAEALIAALGKVDKVVESLEAYQRGYGHSEALRSRILRLWSDCEDRIAQVLATEMGLAQPTPTIRYDAVRLTTLIRALTWKEMIDMAAAADGPAQALAAWLRHAAKGIDAHK